MVLVREYNTTSKKRLERKERKYIEKLCATLNIQLPTRTQKEYQNEFLKEYQKEYYKQNIQTIQAYREQNKQQIKQKNKAYREQNKQKIKQKTNEKIECECGCEISRCGISHHRKTQKHLNLIKQ
jgi:hypothetical protein